MQKRAACPKRQIGVRGRPLWVMNAEDAKQNSPQQIAQLRPLEVPIPAKVVYMRRAKVLRWGPRYRSRCRLPGTHRACTAKQSDPANLSSIEIALQVHSAKLLQSVFFTHRNMDLLQVQILTFHVLQELLYICLNCVPDINFHILRDDL